MILTLDEVKESLKLEYDDEDDLLTRLIKQAQAAAEDFTRVSFDGTNEAPEPVKLACLLMVSHYFEYRDGNDHVAYRTMREAFESLLYPYRDPDLMF